VSTERPAVAVTRTPSGWAVISATDCSPVAGLVEGLCLADLVAEELGAPTDPDRSARRSARGGSSSTEGDDPREARIAELERTVSQLEHALAARVAIERAIGVLAERNGSSPRDAFDGLRQSARSQGRAVTELAHEVLDTLVEKPPLASAPEGTVSPLAAPLPRPPVTADARRGAPSAAEGRS
jgi:ANTAR domain